jgi:hypothetical protein
MEKKGFPTFNALYICVSMFEIDVKNKMSTVRFGEKKNIERCKNKRAGKDDRTERDC